MTIVDFFIRQHFQTVFREIQRGVAPEDRLYFQELTWQDAAGVIHQQQVPRWNTAEPPSKIAVLESIHLFFHLCLNAGKVGRQFSDIEKWSMTLAKIACSQQSHGVYSDFAFRVLMMSPEQITHFLFACLDWNIPEQDNNEFSSRIKFFSNHFSSRDSRKYCQNLLHAMRLMRNPGAHYAYRFYTDRPAVLKILANHLYDYITVLYMVTHVLGYSVKEAVREKIGESEDFRHVRIKISCVDASMTVLPRGCDIRLYHVDNIMQRVLVAVQTIAEQYAEFTVCKFQKYEITIVTNGTESRPSELFVIDEGFFNDSEIHVTAPPTGIMKPQINISELVLFSPDELSENLQFVLNELDHFDAADDEVVRVARSLIMASATSTEHDKRIFEEAMVQMRYNLQQSVPEHLREHLQQQARQINEAMAQPYANADFQSIITQIDEMYDHCFGIMIPPEEYHGMTLAEQYKANLSKFIGGEELMVATTFMKQSLEQQKKIAQLRNVLKLLSDYPEVAEAEFGGESWLTPQIVDHFYRRITFYMSQVSALHKTITRMLDYLKNLSSHEEKVEVARINLKFMHDSLLNTAESSLQFVVLGNQILFKWLDKCVEADQSEEWRTLLCTCRKQIQDIIQNPKNQLNELYIRYYPDEKKKELQELYEELRALIWKQRQNIQTYYQRFEEVSQRKKEEWKSLKGRLYTYLGIYKIPELEKDLYLQERFETFEDWLELFNAETFKRLIACVGPQYRINMTSFCWCGVLPSGQYGEWLEPINLFQNDLKQFESDFMAIYNKLVAIEGINKRALNADQGVLNVIDFEELLSELIVKNQMLRFRAMYKQVPDYLQDIMDIPVEILPNAIRAYLLLNQAITDWRFLNIFFLAEKVNEYNPYFEFNLSDRLGSFIYGKYRNYLTSPEIAAKEFPLLPVLFQEKFIKYLFESHSFSSEYLLAFQLNFPNGELEKGILSAHDFFVYFAKYRLDYIQNYRYVRLKESLAILRCVDEYLKWYPSDKVIEDLHHKQVDSFVTLCSMYLKEHLEINNDCYSSILFSPEVLFDEITPETPPEIISELLKKHHSSLSYHVRISSEEKVETVLTSLRDLYKEYGGNIKMHFDGESHSPFSILLLIREILRHYGNGEEGA